MAHELSIECLNEIFECLEEDKFSLHSCLLDNRLWCEVAVKILWKNIWNFQPLSSTILGTLIACLPNKSKKTFYIRMEILFQHPFQNHHRLI